MKRHKRSKREEKLSIKIFTTPKPLEKKEENQDACKKDSKDKKFAISDGASSIPRSGLWSRILTKNFVKDKNVMEEQLTKTWYKKWLSKSRQEWEKKAEIKKLDPILQHKIEKSQGSASTFLGCIYSKVETKNKLRVIYIGDSCLFLIQKNKIRRSIPLEKSDEFTSNPKVIRSLTDVGDKHIAQDEIEFEVGDIIILATDELAEWILSRKEKGENPWLKLENLTQKKFEDLIEEIRKNNEVDEDDMTVIICRISEKDEKITKYT